MFILLVKRDDILIRTDKMTVISDSILHVGISEIW